MLTFLADATIVSGDRVLHESTLVIDDDVVADIRPSRPGRAERQVRRLTGRTIVPGFIDAHVHGVAGVDVLHGPGSVDRVARALPRWGVTAFSPTSLACPPDVLDTFLAEVSACRALPAPGAAHVLPAHLESNFINPQYRGAQPGECLCGALDRQGSFAGTDILGVIDAHAADVGIITLAPELSGGIELTRRFVSQGKCVSLGHTGATYEEAIAAFEAGATRATHLFSAMRPLTHRDPGVIGAVLARPDVVAETICDGVHLHRAVFGVVLAAKTARSVLAITDGTAASGLPHGSRTFLGPRPVTALDAARLDDGALAGSVATMDTVFARLVRDWGLDLATAVRLTAVNPARDLRLDHAGTLEAGFQADFVVLGPELTVEETWIDGRLAWPASGSG